MKKYITSFSLALNVILIVIFFFFYNSYKIVDDLRDAQNVSKVKSDSITNDVAINVIFDKIDSNFNLILTTITILFSLFVLLTFFGVKEQFAFQLSKIKKNIRKQNASWDEHKSDILDLRGDLSFEVADKIEKDLKVLFDKPNKEYSDFVSIVELTLVCCDYYSQSLAFKMNVYPKFKSRVLSILKNNLSTASELISTQDNFVLQTMGYERFLRVQDSIHKVCDLEDKQNLASIFSKLSFPSLD